MNNLKPVYHGEHGLQMLKELARSYLTITKDLVRVVSRLKALYRSWDIPCVGNEVYAPRHRSEWLSKITEAGAHDSAQYRVVEGQPQRSKKPMKGAATRASSAAGMCWSQSGLVGPTEVSMKNQAHNPE